MIPHCSTVHMHAGKGNGKEGSWEGDGANMHFELMMDQFDILFNLVLRVCAQGVCKILACMRVLYVLHGTGHHPPTPLIVFGCRWLTHHWLVQMILLTSHMQAEPAAFQYVLVMQVDRSQGHLKQDDDGLNTTIANSNAGWPKSAAGAKTRHFRHTFQPLPAPHTDWRQHLVPRLFPGKLSTRTTV